MYKGDVMNMILPPPTNEGFLALLSWGQKDIWMGGGGCPFIKWKNGEQSDRGMQMSLPAHWVRLQSSLFFVDAAVILIVAFVS